MTRNICGIDRGGRVNPTPFMRRAATRDLTVSYIRGLKPTATIMRSLRDHARRRATTDGNHGFQPTWAFQRPDARTPVSSRRIATIDRSRGFQPTDHQPNRIFRRVATVESTGPAELAAAIQTNLEELGV